MARQSSAGSSEFFERDLEAYIVERGSAGHDEWRWIIFEPEIEDPCREYAESVMANLEQMFESIISASDPEEALRDMEVSLSRDIMPHLQKLQSKAQETLENPEKLKEFKNRFNTSIRRTGSVL